MTKCGIYIRVSSAEQAKEDKTSLAYQEAGCRAFAESHGYVVAGIYSDPGVTGSAIPGYKRGQRQGLQQLLDDVKDGKIAVAIAFAVDRLSRDQNVMGHIAMSILACGGRLEFATEDFEDSPTGTFMRSVQTFAAEFERHKIKARARQGRHGRAAKGLSNASTPPYGYQRPKGGNMAIARKEADVVRRMYRDYTVDGKSLRRIALDLTAEKVPMKRGGRLGWTAENVRRLLLREAYTGRGWQNTKHAVSRGVYLPNPPEEWLPMKYPKIIDRETYDKAIARLQSNRSWRTRARDDRALFVLQGLLHCGECFRSMLSTRGGSSRARVRSYTCHGQLRRGFECRKPGWVRAERIEEPVWAAIVAACKNPDLWVASSADYQAAEAALGGDADTRAADLRRKIADEERTIARLQSVVAASKDTPRAAARLMKNIEEIEETLDALRLSLEQQEGRVADRAAQALARAQAEDYAREIGPRLDSATAAEQAEIIRALVKRVFVHADDTITIDAYLPALANTGRRVSPTTIKVAKLIGVRP